MTPSEKKRFWAMVVKTASCWLWVGASKTEAGGLPYGLFTRERRAGETRGRTVLAHRFAFEARNGPLPAGTVLRHRCDNPKCIRPGHAKPGTQKENIADMFRKGRAPRQDGENNGAAKLTNKQVREIRASLSSGKSSQVLQVQFGISEATISRIRNHVVYPGV